MKTYRFLGTEATIGGAQPGTLTQYGQKLQLADESLIPALLSGAPLLPEDRFATHAISDTELQKYFATQIHETAPADFLAKRNAAWEDMHRFRDEVLNPKTEVNQHGDTV